MLLRRGPANDAQVSNTILSQRGSRIVRDVINLIVELQTISLAPLTDND